MDENLPAETPSCSPVMGLDPFELTPIVYNWVDVTASFKEACDTLDSGVLVRDGNFTLYEAMSAIEMMDPKMDSWMVGQKVKREILSFKESCERGVIKLNDFTPEELILMMDHCHACLLSWLDGQSLAQTVFTFLYLHEPENIQNRCLKAFCYGVLKLCHMIMEKIRGAGVYEEEDFQMMQYRFNFGYDVTNTRVVGMLREVEDDYGRLIRNTKAQKQKSNTEKQEELSKELISLDGVMRRIKFLRVFLQALTPFGAKLIEPANNIKKYFTQMEELLKVIKKTAPTDVKTTTSDDTDLLIPGFEPLVNQRLIPPTFPRYTKLNTITEAYEVYDGIVSRMQTITDMMSSTSLQAVMQFIVSFSRTNPCVLTRSLAQIQFCPTRMFAGVQSLEVIRDSIKSFNAPPCFSSNRYHTVYSHPVVKDYLDAFLRDSLVSMSKMFQVYGHNYARQREKLGHIIEGLALLQDHGDRVDAQINELMKKDDDENEQRNHLAYLGGWTLYHNLKVMIEYISSGFVLELYSNHELHYIYWYLTEVLLNWQLQTLNRAGAQLHLEETICEQNEEARKTRSSNKKAKRNKNKKQTTIRQHAHEITTTQAWLALGLGMFKALIGFKIGGKFQSPDFHLDNEQIRYEHRFAPFHCVSTPSYLSYRQFRMMTDTSHCITPPQAEDLFVLAAKHFAAAKTFCENMPESVEMQKLLLVAKNNFVATKILSGGHNKLKKNIHLDFTTHRTFPIIKIN